MPPRVRCRICSSAFVSEVNSLFVAGWSSAKIAIHLRDNMDFKVTDDTVRTHRRLHLSDLGATKAGAGKHAILPPTPEIGTDFAVAIQQKALQNLAAGKLKVTARDGIAAQGLIDRREERSEDRKFMLGLARLLSGGGGGAPATVIDGEYTELSQIAAPNPLLAPPELRSDAQTDVPEPVEIEEEPEEAFG